MPTFPRSRLLSALVAAGLLLTPCLSAPAAGQEAKPRAERRTCNEITHRIVTELEVKLLHGEEARVWRKSTRNREAYDLYFQAREIHDRFTQADVAHATHSGARTATLTVPR